MPLPKTKKSLETRVKMSQRQIGSKNHMFGMKKELHHNYGKSIHSEEVKNRIKLTKKKNAKSCEHCGKTMALANHNRWHGSNCKVIKSELA